MSALLTLAMSPLLLFAGGLAIHAPDVAEADGATPIDVLVTEGSSAATGVQLVTSAGAATPDPVRDGRFVIVPPRFAAGASMTVTALSPDGTSAVRTIRLNPAPFTYGSVELPGRARVEGPSRVLLGAAPTIDFLVRRWSSEEPPVVHLSAGSVAASTRLPDGGWRVRVALPEASFPRHLLLAFATRDGEVLAWSALPLFGSGDIETWTDPAATVRVRVDGEEFGPVQADARGFAKLRIFSSPRPRLAETLAEDALGNRVRRPLDLAVPAATRLLGLCRGRTRQMVVLVVDADGAPRPNAPLLVSAGREPTTLIELSPGMYVVDGGNSSGVVEVAVQLRGDGSSRASCRWPPGARLPARIAVRAPPAYRAGSGGLVEVELESTDPDGRRMPATLTARTDFGEAEALRLLEPGLARMALRISDAFAGREKVTVEGALAGAGVLGRADIALEAGEPVAIESLVERVSTSADGATATVLAARAVDRWGNAVHSAPLSGRADGAVEAFRWDVAARAHQARYVPPERFEPGRDEVLLRVDGQDAQARVPVQLLPVLPRLSFGARAGYAAGIAGGAPTILADAQYRHRELSRRLSMGVEASYLWRRYHRADEGGGADVNTTVAMGTLLARASYVAVFSPVRLYGGAGGGMLWLSRETDSAHTGRSGRAGLSPAMAPHAGAERRIGPGAVAVEASMLLSRSSDPAFASTLRLFLVTGGYRLEL
ncbi:MAG: hypothetical protein ACK4N5_06150 [Myxococcales bacterium]